MLMRVMAVLVIAMGVYAANARAGIFDDFLDSLNFELKLQTTREPSENDENITAIYWNVHTIND